MTEWPAPIEYDEHGHPVVGTIEVNGDLTVNESAVFNEDGADEDFRVESDDVENMLFVDGNENRVGIGTGTPTAVLNVSHATEPYVYLTRSTDGVSASNQLGFIAFRGIDTGVENTGCGIVGIATADWTDTSSPGYVRIRAVPDGSTTSQVIADFAAAGIVINENSADQDLRIETNGEENMVMVDGGNDALYLGGTTNGVKITKGGELSLIGTATVYDDIFLPINIANLPGVNTPTVTALTTNTSMLTFAIGDYANPATGELPHGYAEGTDLDVHLHLIANGTDVAATKARYIVYYTIGDNGEVMSAEGNLTAEQTFAAGVTDRTHLYLDMGNISGANMKIGAMLQMRVKRLDNSDHPGHVTFAEPTSDPFVAMLGVHYQIDTMGSKTETAK